MKKLIFPTIAFFIMLFTIGLWCSKDKELKKLKQQNQEKKLELDRLLKQKNALIAEYDSLTSLKTWFSAEVQKLLRETVDKDPLLWVFTKNGNREQLGFLDFESGVHNPVRFESNLPDSVRVSCSNFRYERDVKGKSVSDSLWVYDARVNGRLLGDPRDLKKILGALAKKSKQEYWLFFAFDKPKK